MQRRDYLDQQIEQLGRVLAQLLSEAIGFKNRSSEATDCVNAVLQKELGWDTDDLLEIPETQWIETLLATGKFNSANLESFADLLLWQEKRTDDAKRNKLLRKCLLIYEHIDKADRIFSAERQAKITSIRQKLAGQ
ncbi:hypothetical protein [Flavobacterium sp.]|uniref:hypothetical protein n=1 Tax=Flavobacterium sp. TaxID=239 RepID=UPI0039E3BB92